MNDDTAYPTNVLRFRPREGASLPAFTTGIAHWPLRLRQHSEVGPHGRPYFLLLIRMEVPAGRSREDTVLVEDYAPRSHISNSMTFGHVHSRLQEPHGGHPCQYAGEHSCPVGAEEARLYRQFVAEDGPRDGVGEVTVTVRVEDRSGQPVLDLKHTFSECNLLRDVRSLLPLIPETPFGSSA
ncbi:MAG: Ig-like domain-containing protein [Streptomycetaceae bacterium]|nr:Ig-like domain-containing protein [Streptomycetaceae bacterium]